MSTSVASVTSHFPDAENGFTTTTSGSVASGATTVGLNSTAGYTNGEPVVMVIDPSNSSKKQTFTGIIDTSGNQVTGVVWTAGSNVAHDNGATVVDYATATHIAMISKGIKVEHSQDGTHATTLITSRTADNTPASGDSILTSDVSAANALKKVTIANLFANIPADSVEDADMVYGKLRTRQGGSATDWSTAGTTAYDYSATNVFIQCGSKTIDASPTTLTFPTAFNQPPVVVAIQNGLVTSSAFTRINSTTATTASISMVSDAGAAITTEKVFWIAIGE